MHTHLTAPSECIVSTQDVETAVPTTEVVIDLGNVAVKKFHAFIDLASVTADPEATPGEPLDVLAEALLHYLGRTLVVSAIVKPFTSIHLVCVDTADVATVKRHTRDYLCNRAGLSVQEDDGPVYRGRGSGVER